MNDTELARFDRLMHSMFVHCDVHKTVPSVERLLEVFGTHSISTLVKAFGPEEAILFLNYRHAHVDHVYFTDHSMLWDNFIGKSYADRT